MTPPTQNAREQLQALTSAAWFVPIKQHDRSTEDQERVEAFTAAVVEAREWLRANGCAVDRCAVDSSLCEACGGWGKFGGVPELQGAEVTCRDCGGTGRAR